MSDKNKNRDTKSKTPAPSAKSEGSLQRSKPRAPVKGTDNRPPRPWNEDAYEAASVASRTRSTKNIGLTTPEPRAAAPRPPKRVVKPNPRAPGARSPRIPSEAQGKAREVAATRARKKRNRLVSRRRTNNRMRTTWIYQRTQNSRRGAQAGSKSVILPRRPQRQLAPKPSEACRSRNGWRAYARAWKNFARCKSSSSEPWTGTQPRQKKTEGGQW